MAKAFSIASWNIEHFGALGKDRKPKKAIGPVLDFLAAQNADVIALYEIVGSTVFRPMMEKFPSHQFFISEGPQTQEILVGVRKTLSAFTTQKVEFKSGQSTLRPGQLLTLLVNGEFYPLLFLHLKSLPDPKGFGLRDDMIRRALKFRGVLDRAPGAEGNAHYIFLGDLNTMGFDYPFTKHDISAEDEIAELDRRTNYRNMRRLPKRHELTWWNGNEKYAPGSNLDHVVAADHLSFRTFAGGSEVDVRGWADESTDSKKRKWIEKHSDHGLLYFEVQRP